MLKRLQVKGFKSLVDVEARFSSLAVLFGLNAAGKSNILDALRLVSNIGTCRTLKHAFAPPYRGKAIESFALGNGGVKELISRKRINLTIEADLRLSDSTIESVNREIRSVSYRRGEEVHARQSAGPPQVQERDLRYRITVEMRPALGVLCISDEYLAPLNSTGSPTVKDEPFLQRRGDRLLLRLDGQDLPVEFDRYLDRSVISMRHHPPHCPHLVAARRELESWQFFYFEPRERMRAAAQIEEVRQIGLMGQDLAGYLRTLQALRPRQFWAVEKALHMMIPDIDGIEFEVNDFGEVEMSIREGGLSLSTRVLSEGTLRILALLAIGGLEDEPALVGIEEPENGIHPTRLGLIAELLQSGAGLGQTQYFVTTHSPALVDMLPMESLFAVRRSHRHTRIDPVSDWGPLAHSGGFTQSRRDQETYLPVSKRILRGDFSA